MSLRDALDRRWPPDTTAIGDGLGLALFVLSAVLVVIVGCVWAALGGAQ